MMNAPDSQNLLNARIELEHIQLELRNGRTQHFRHFVDQYYCYKKGHVKRTGTAHWESFVWKGNVSLHARKLGNRKLVVKEHAMPLLVIRGLLADLFRAGNATLDGIAKLLDENVVFATISKEEDARLRRLGLSSKMPDGFGIQGNVLCGDLLARYKFADIEME